MPFIFFSLLSASKVPLQGPLQQQKEKRNSREVRGKEKGKEMPYITKATERKMEEFLFLFARPFFRSLRRARRKEGKEIRREKPSLNKADFFFFFLSSERGVPSSPLHNKSGIAGRGCPSALPHKRKENFHFWFSSFLSRQETRGGRQTAIVCKKESKRKKTNISF